MKQLAPLLLLLFLSQGAVAQQPVFFRVYNTEGKKVNKGVLFSLGDSSFTLIRKNILVETALPDIGVVKSKRTTAHRMLITTASVVTLTAFFIATVYTYNRQPGPGYINTGSKRNNRRNNDDGWRKIPKPLKQYEVNGDEVKWKEQRKLLGYQLL